MAAGEEQKRTCPPFRLGSQDHHNISSQQQQTRDSFGDRRKLLELVASQVRLKVPESSSSSPLFGRLGDEGDAEAVPLQVRKSPIIQIYKVEKGHVRTPEKGDWRGIARNFVVFRAPTQIASHAQKYFIRQSNTSRRKRRSSLFDMVPDVPVDQLPVLDEQFPTESSQASEDESTNQPPPLNLSLDLDCKPMESPSDESPLETEEPNVNSILPPVMVPAFFPTYVPFPPFSAWPQNSMPAVEEKTETHKVLKLIPIFPKDPVNGDGLVKGVLPIHLTTARSIGRVANVESD